ncbi:hypothetical protein J7384_16855 [Endozoicomonas sp. G2_1]|uniref:hypothetical protein n=1 Tax=Endozoicomonas sp. G2_1 TaxID=2821091 RepID=UPI001ADC5AF0|nr:hypothetical protein [Endozoicomonas sp. G2_1]MBO9492033.1 hypothetical protein [Endozoicomonas sp. G2_1]
MEFINKNKTAIAVSIISTIVFLYILQPLLEFIGVAFISFASYINTSYVDKIYAQISHLELLNYGLFFYTVFSSCLISVLLTTIFALWKKEKTTSEDETENNKKSPKLKRLTALALVITTLFILSISTRIYQFSILTSFKQHFRIIAAYIPEQEEENILSQWSLMQSKEDYELVQKKIENIAKDNGIKLPSNAIYSLNSI